MAEQSVSRPPTIAPAGMVCSPHALASAAGVDVLRAGGSAVDAALAIRAVLSVVHPHMKGFGSGVMANGTGVVLQNRSSHFSLDPSHPNRLEAGKRPMHALIASMAVQDGVLRHIVGCMGEVDQSVTKRVLDGHRSRVTTRLFDSSW